MTYSKNMLFGLIFLAVIFEVARELCFSRAAKGEVLKKSILKPITFLGIGLWVLEITLTVFVLQYLPLNIVFPLTATVYIITTIGAAVLLKEKLSMRRLSGAFLVGAGVACIGGGGMMKDHSFYLPGSRSKGVMLIHGLTGSPAEMRYIGKDFNRMGFTVYAPTIAGHCINENALIATKYEDWVKSIADALQRFQGEVDEIYIAGICVGGAIGLFAAQLCQGLNIKGVAIYSPTITYDGWNVPFYYHWENWGIPLVAHLPFIRKLGFAEKHPYGIKSDRIRKAAFANGGIEGTLPHFPIMSVYQNVRLNRALLKLLPDIKIPTLLVHSTEDDVSHPRNADLIQRLHGGHCEIALLDNSYHLVHIDQERHKVSNLSGVFFGIPILSETQVFHG